MVDIGALTDATCGDDEGPLTLVLEGEEGDVRLSVADVSAARRLVAAVGPVMDLVAAHEAARREFIARREEIDTYSKRYDLLIEAAQ